MQKKLLAIFGVVIALAMVLAACQPAAETTPETIIEERVVTEVVEQVVTEIVEVEVEVEREVERNGAWVDTVVMVADPSTSSAVARILADDIDVYAQSSTDTEALQTVQDEGLNYVVTVGSYNEITLNPADPMLNDGSLNPFGVPAIREAMNLLMDRDFIVQEILGGLGIPKYLPLNGVFPDYANFAAKARELEAKYAYNLEAADATITAEMEALGAEKVDGVWTYEGEPVTLIGVIRTEDERLQVGDYIANQLESIGFTVDRQYKTAAEASPIWLRSAPADGQYHFYTGGWITTAISRDDGGNFQFFYSPRSVYGFTPLWQAYQVSDEFDQVSQDLNNNNFSTLEERAVLFERGLELAMENSIRVWLNDSTAFSPFAADVSVTYDLAGGISGTALWGRTIRFVDEIGGQVTVALADLTVDPWNPIGGSNWIYDAMPQRAASDFGLLLDPYTGLQVPNRIESAEVTVEEGLPVGVTMDWVSLEFAPEIVVPGDAWVDWNAADQVFITAEEKLAVMAEEAAAAAAAAEEEAAEAEEGEEAEEAEAPEVPTAITAKMKSVVTYPADLFETITWHDGSPLTVADFVMGMILTFDQGKEDSPIYDESQVGAIESFMAAFKGMKVVSTDPLVLEFYSDNYALDAENNVTSFWPQYEYGEAPWHMLALGIKAETDGELAFTANKADALEVEWLGYTSGPSLEILRAKVTEAIEESYIPYAATLGQFVTEEDALARYENILDWYRVQGHFWVNSGPFYVNKVFPVEKTLTLTRFADYPDSATKWAGYGEPKIADVEVDGPGRVTIGEEAVFEAFVTFQGEPYASAEIKEVNYLLFDATGTLVEVGPAEMLEEGIYGVTLSAETTGALEAGSNKLEIVVVPLTVSVPTFAAFEFVTAE
jgi:peptide/nickel transport system substrate-binding protein